MTQSEPKIAESSGQELIGRVVGKYEIVRLIGGGGMGRVYEGLNKAIGKRVALKFIEKDAATHDAIARFQREAQAASTVESAHIVEIFDSGETEEGMPFIVMELLRGEDLGHRIRRLGRLDLPEALTITAQILRGLHRAHEAGIIHRDLKPDNVFLLDRDDDQVFAKIVDFGVSKITRRGGEGRSTTITQEGTVLGTPVYMSPEQAQAQSDVDHRADLYSVGAILYECLCGRPPHSGGTYEQVIVNICMKDADDIRVHNPGVPEGTALVIAKALSRDRDVRYQSAREFLDELISGSEGILTGRSISGSEISGSRKEQTVIRSDSSSSGSRTLGAVSTVAAVPPQLAKSGATESGPSKRLYAAVGIGGILIGAGTIFYFAEGSGSTAAPPTPAPVFITVHDGVASASGTPGGVVSAPVETAAPIVTVSAAPSAAASAAPSATASATATASAKPTRPTGPVVPPPGTGLHILPH